jgi:hypothetical protein
MRDVAWFVSARAGAEVVAAVNGGRLPSAVSDATPASGGGFGGGLAGRAVAGRAAGAGAVFAAVRDRPLA